MARKFTDTSALFKLYRAEPNSALIQAEIAPDDTVLLAQITPLEFRSACYGLVRQRLLSLQDAQAYVTTFETYLPQYIIVPIDDAVLARASKLTDAYSHSISLRPLDAIQLASALEEHAREPIDAFITTDAVLARVALASGLSVLP